MTILAVRLVGDPVLRTQTEPVTRFDDALRRLAADMHQTMDEVQGVGLAGPQIGSSLSIFVFRIGDQRGTVCNPVIDASASHGVEADHGSEGCLSVPGLGFPLDRPAVVTVSGQDEFGEPITLSGEGLLARCFQHETDHLAGMLYVDRLEGDARKNAWRAIREPGFAQNAQRVERERAGAVASAFGVVGKAFSAQNGGFSA